MGIDNKSSATDKSDSEEMPLGKKKTMAEKSSKEQTTINEKSPTKKLKLVDKLLPNKLKKNKTSKATNSLDETIPEVEQQKVEKPPAKKQQQKVKSGVSPQKNINKKDPIAGDVESL